MNYNTAPKTSKTFLFVILGIIVVGLVGGFLILMNFNQNNASTGTTPETLTTPTNIVHETGFAIGDGKLLSEEELSQYPAVVDIYQDYLCPHCATFEEINGQPLYQYQMENPGKVAVVYHLMTFQDTTQTREYSARAANAALHVLLNKPETFHDYNNTLFANQPAGLNQLLSDTQLVQLIPQALDESDVESLNNRTYIPWLNQTTDEILNSQKIQGTPAVFVNDEEVGGEVLQDPSGLVGVLDEKLNN